MSDLENRFLESPIMIEEEFKKFLFEVNNTARDYPADKF